MTPYDDIINLPHPTSKLHPRMPLADRAAQFGAFAALRGFDEEIDRTRLDYSAEFVNFAGSYEDTTKTLE